MKLRQILIESKLWVSPNKTYGRLPIKGKTLATYTDEDGYMVAIIGQTKSDEASALGVRRYGVKQITNPAGKWVKGGYWMNWPEDDWHITKAEWNKMSWEERAAKEVVEQGTKYSLKKNFEFHEKNRK